MFLNNEGTIQLQRFGKNGMIYYKCPYCEPPAKTPLVTSKKHEMYLHLQEVHKNNRESCCCSVCGIRGTSEDIRQHIITTHGATGADIQTVDTETNIDEFLNVFIVHPPKAIYYICRPELPGK